MRPLIQRLYLHGTSGACDAQRVRMQIVNLMSALGLAISVAFGFGHLALGAPQAFAFSLVAGLGYIGHFPLQSRGRGALGRRLIASTFMLHIAGLTLLFGTEAGFQVYFVLGGPIAMLVFSEHDRGWRAATVAASLLLYVALELHAPAAMVALDPGWGQRVMLLSTVPAIVFVLLVIHGMYLGELHKREASLERAARTDALTGLPNRRCGFEHALAAFAHARRSGAAMAVLMLDIDHFKQVNDRHGHAAGDAVLTHVARSLVQRLRHEDMLARWGGEEFLIVVSTAAQNDAHAVAQVLLERVASARVRHDHVPLSCTASIGVAVMSPQDGTFEALVARADRALYEAKARGRNRVVVDASLDGPPRSLRSLPPEGAVSDFGRPGVTDGPPRSLRSLPPEGAVSDFGRPGVTDGPAARLASPWDPLPSGATVQQDHEKRCDFHTPASAFAEQPSSR